MLNLGSLNPQQRLAVETINGPVLILAGAGTGKTRVITYRIAHMIERGIAPDHILGVTFTNKAAREMQERVRSLVPRLPSRASASPDKRSGKDNPKPTLCTFHSLCVRILRQHIEKLGYKRNFVIYDESEQLSAIKKILAQISARGLKLEPSEVLSQLSRIKNAEGKASMLEGESDALALAHHVRPRYENALRACNAVDFDDLILLTLRLFREHPPALEACRAHYQYVMVDEYQDTNAAQFQLVYSLTCKHRNLCVVGDDDQSIYGWRGADLSNLLDMEKHFPGVKVIKLEQNYRSTNTILGAANAVIARNAFRRGKNLWSQKGEGAKITMLAFSNDEAEAQGIVDLIEQRRLIQRVPWSAQAILFRTNAQSRPLEMALRKQDIRYHLVGGQSFFDRREVRDFLAYIKTFVNPNDDISLLRIANVPARGLSEQTMQRLLAASHERTCSVFATMKNPVVSTSFSGKTREAIEVFVAFIDRTRASIHVPEHASSANAAAAWAERVLSHIDYARELRRLEKDQEAADARLKNLKELMVTMDNSDLAGKTIAERLEDFLERVSLDTERDDEKETRSDAVTLITMHSCKGLEFPHVYIVGLEEGLLPHSRSLEENTLDEERRLFYVAMTRAMQTLTISHCASRKKYGQTSVEHPSHFLKDLPADLVEDGDAKAKVPVTVSAGKSHFQMMRDAIGE